MMHIRARLPLIAAAAIVALSVPRDADAQFLKKVKDAAKKQAAEAVGIEKKSDSAATSTDAASPAATPASSSGKTSSPSSSGRRSSGQITITAEVLDAFVGAFDEELAWQKEQARIRASHVAFEESVKKYDTCKANAMTKPENMEGADQAAADRYMAIGERLANEALKLTQTNDTLRIRIVNDSAQHVSDLAMRAMIPGIKKCGVRPTTPPSWNASPARCCRNCARPSHPWFSENPHRYGPSAVPASTTTTCPRASQCAIARVSMAQRRNAARRLPSSRPRWSLSWFFKNCER